ncbi:MAG TPA: YraN family protein [Candidatus Limnocylindrales bacterium]|nr:YraN family protein [Candidatus Limnocylindrales bacterium]
MATTARRQHGDRAEALVARGLAAGGWTIVGRNVRVGRDELDLVALDPGPPATLVAVEVRSVSSGRFGPPEARVDGAKVRRCYRAAFALRAAGCLPGGAPLPRLPWRVDLVAVELDPSLGRGLGGPVVRHLRGLYPG